MAPLHNLNCLCAHWEGRTGMGQRPMSSFNQDRVFTNAEVSRFNLFEKTKIKALPLVYTRKRSTDAPPPSPTGRAERPRSGTKGSCEDCKIMSPRVAGI